MDQFFVRVHNGARQMSFASHCGSFLINNALRTAAILGLAVCTVSAAQAQSCAPVAPRLDSGAGFTPFNSLERLEARSGRTGTADWEWGVGTNTQQSGKFTSSNLDWVSGRTLDWTLTYSSNGSATLTVKNGSSQVMSLSYASSPNGMRSGNALKFDAKTTADAGDAKVYVVPKSIKGMQVTGDLETAGNGTLSEKSLFYYFPAMANGFTATGTVKFTFKGATPPQGSRMSFVVTAGNINCTSATDTTKPTINATTPPAPLINTGTPLISAQYADSGSGIDLAAVKLLVDSVDVTSKAQISTSGISYTPAPGLSNGAHRVQLSVGDKAGNVAQTEWSFAVDDLPPSITALSPLAGAVVGGSVPLSISASFADAGSGVNAESVQLELDGVNVSASAIRLASSLSYANALPLAPGEHTYTITVQDNAGNRIAKTIGFRVKPPLSIIDATPQDVVTRNARPEILASWGDTGGDIVAANVRVLLNGVQTTANVTLIPPFVRINPTIAFPDGLQTVRITLTDSFGATVDREWSFTVDTAAAMLTEDAGARGTRGVSLIKSSAP